jgi:hypothetical protein
MLCQKITILPWFFPSKLSQSAATSQWIESRQSQRLFSVGYTLTYDRPGVIFSLSQVQNFLGDEGDYPFKPPNRRGHLPLRATPWCIWWRRRRKSAQFLATFRKHVFGAKTEQFFTVLGLKEGVGGSRVRFFAYIWGKGLGIWILYKRCLRRGCILLI